MWHPAKTTKTSKNIPEKPKSREAKKLRNQTGGYCTVC